MNSDSRSILGALTPRPNFAPSLPASAGGWPVGGLVAGFSLLITLLIAGHSIPDGATGYRLASLLRGDEAALGEGALWVMLARIFESLPIGPTPVWRITILSAAAHALAAGLLAVWLRQRDVGRRAAVGGGLLFAFSLPVWETAVKPSSASLVTALALLILVLLEEARAHRRRLPKLIGCFFIGLTLLQGPIAVGGVLAILFAAALPRSRIRRPHDTASWAIPLSFTLGGAALGVLLAGGVHSLAIPYVLHPGGWAPSQPANALMEVAWSSGPTGICAAIGLFVLWSRHPGDAATLTLVATTPLLAALMLGARGGISGEPPEFTQAIPLTYAALAALAAAVLDTLLQKFAATPSRKSHLLTAASAALPLAVLVIWTPYVDRSNSRYTEEWARSTLRSLPREAVLFAGPDSRGGILEWVQLIEGERPDVLLPDPGGFIDSNRSPILQIEAVHSLPLDEAIEAFERRSSRPIFSIVPIPIKGGRWSPWGLVWRRTAPGQGTANESEDAWKSVKFSHIPDNPEGAREWIGGESRVPPRDRIARRIAADYFQALARKSGNLSQIGPWATVLNELDRLRNPRPRWFSQDDSQSPRYRSPDREDDSPSARENAAPAE